MAPRLLDDEWWPFLQRMEGLCRQGIKPHRAAVQLVAKYGHTMPGTGASWSKVKMLQDRYRKRRDEFAAEPCTIEFEIPMMQSPMRLTLVRRWFTKLINIRAAIAINTKNRSG
jgi:hypothetical protein